jgi:hypothetical protein
LYRYIAGDALYGGVSPQHSASASSASASAAGAASAVPRVLGDADRLGLHAAELSADMRGAVTLGAPGTVFKAGPPWWRREAED